MVNLKVNHTFLLFQIRIEIVCIWKYQLDTFTNITINLTIFHMNFYEMIWFLVTGFKQRNL